jgi:glycine/D-amino acid oxidase-like deaminating enzyme
MRLARPLWVDTAGAARRRDALAGDLDVDVAIVGGGYTGLWTALSLRRRDPTLRVVVLETEHVGFGASGRNGGWCSSFLPMGLATMSAAHGRDAAIRMQRAMFAAVDDVGATGVDCDYAKGGTVTAAHHGAQMQRIEQSVSEQRQFGFGAEDVRVLDRDELADLVRIDGAIGGSFSPRCAALHPLKLVHGLADSVESSGAVIHESTRVTSIGSRHVTTERGRVRADVVVRATEAWTASFERRRLAPIYSLMIATEPLDASTLDSIGLATRPTFNDARRVVIYGQRTADGRIAFGGRGAPYHFASRVRPSFDVNRRVHDGLAETLRELFPVLRDAQITHRWGGALGLPRDWHASVGFDRAAGVAWAGGYVGDGVAASNLAGRTLADLITGTDSDLVTLPWVGHRSPNWEPEPLRWIGINSLVRLPGWIDRVERRSGRSPRLRSRLLDRLTGH